MGRDHLGKARLGDRGRRPRQCCVMRDLRACSQGIGADADRAEACESKSYQQCFRTVLEMHQHPVSRADTSLRQPPGEARRISSKLPVGPYLHFSFERRPNQEWMVAPLACTCMEQTVEVQSSERREHSHRRRIATPGSPSQATITRTRGRRRLGQRAFGGNIRGIGATPGFNLATATSSSTLRMAASRSPCSLMICNLLTGGLTSRNCARRTLPAHVRTALAASLVACGRSTAGSDGRHGSNKLTPRCGRLAGGSKIFLRSHGRYSFVHESRARLTPPASLAGTTRRTTGNGAQLQFLRPNLFQRVAGDQGFTDRCRRSTGLAVLGG